MNKGILLIISGFSGTGKGTIVKELLNKYDDYVVSVSATTRAIRQGEKEGSSYFFISKEEFESRIKKDEFLEYACYVDNYYGTPKKYVMDMLALGKNVILEIECQGAYKVKTHFPEAITVFVTAPSIKDVVDRLKARGTETDEQINDRIMRAAQEADYIKAYDYLVVNDELDKAVETINGIVTSNRYRSCNSLEKIKEIQNEFKEM